MLRRQGALLHTLGSLLPLPTHALTRRRAARLYTATPCRVAALYRAALASPSPHPRVAACRSAHIAETIRKLKEQTEGRLLVEALVPDFSGKLDCVAEICSSGLDVFAHNVETVPRLQSVVRDRRANWAQSISVLRAAKANGARVTKTSIMLGCGESPDEVLETLRLLREASVDVVTLGQYMRPTKKHMAVSEYITPAAFAAYQTQAEAMGFLYVASGPMVRSSYRAGEYFLKNVLSKAPEQAAAAGV